MLDIGYLEIPSHLGNVCCSTRLKSFALIFVKKIRYVVSFSKHGEVISEKRVFFSWSSLTVSVNLLEKTFDWARVTHPAAR